MPLNHNGTKMHKLNYGGTRIYEAKYNGTTVFGERNTLSLSAGAGLSSLSVTRTASASGESTGVGIGNGGEYFYGDTLSISAATASGYKDPKITITTSQGAADYTSFPVTKTIVGFDPAGISITGSAAINNLIHNMSISIPYTSYTGYGFTKDITDQLAAVKNIQFLTTNEVICKPSADAEIWQRQSYMFCDVEVNASKTPANGTVTLFPYFYNYTGGDGDFEYARKLKLTFSNGYITKAIYEHYDYAYDTNYNATKYAQAVTYPLTFKYSSGNLTLSNPSLSGYGGDASYTFYIRNDNSVQVYAKIIDNIKGTFYVYINPNTTYSYSMYSVYNTTVTAQVSFTATSYMGSSTSSYSVYSGDIYYGGGGK